MRARGLNIAVVGSGVAGLSAGWLLSQGNSVTLFEADGRLGGHGNTVDAYSPNGPVAVDTGFIVYNEATYPNLVALFRHLNIPTKESDMSFAVSIDDGALEYNGTNLAGLFAQPSNCLRPRFWRMLLGIRRFYREAAADLAVMGEMSLNDYLKRKGYGAAFRDDHLLPMAAAIWSTPADRIGEYPAAALVRFCQNHGLLQARDRPAWRTVDGGSRVYIERLAREISPAVRTSAPVKSVRRTSDGVAVRTQDGDEETYDHVVLASHADQSLAILADPTPRERRLLGAFHYGANDAVLHTDAALMPKRRAAWASWNYLARSGASRTRPCVTYWMNNLQGIPGPTPLFVTLNPDRPIREDRVSQKFCYEHPLFDAAAMDAQKQLWSLQGDGGVWFCGAYFGSGFHEDGLQAGLAVAEQLGGARRPWTVPNESSRIWIDSAERRRPAREAAE